MELFKKDFNYFLEWERVCMCTWDHDLGETKCRALSQICHPGVPKWSFIICYILLEKFQLQNKEVIGITKYNAQN